MIRDYEPARHRTQLRSCIVELQEFERGLEPTLPKGEAMADRYLAHVLQRCSEASGRIFVAEVEGAVVGFVGVLARIVPEPDESQAYAYVSDLIVVPAYRRRGIGRALLERAERFARGEGAKALRVGVLAKNEPAGRLYRRLGFTDYTIQLNKPLR
jgi:ribosomal protein S18 acetylase RimI-like enzyme